MIGVLAALGYTKASYCCCMPSGPSADLVSFFEQSWPPEAFHHFAFISMPSFRSWSVTGSQSQWRSPVSLMLVQF